MANYLGGSQNLYNFVQFSLSVPVQQGDFVEGIQGPCIGGMVDRILGLLKFEQLPADHPQPPGEFVLSLFYPPTPTNQHPN